MRDSFILLAGSLLAAAGVMLGAFGAHALRARVSEQMLATWETAVFYHLVHAVALVALAAFAARLGAVAGSIAWLFLVGVLLFSGSLYALVLSGLRPLGMITPVGGVALIAAWLWLAFAAWKLH
ncbi:MAG: DUF423 domain-containing protein [Gammaproteobacteria bacterium]|nr:DUF423 domain-containing protein [Gammaproteobacteria bacterium]